MLFGWVSDRNSKAGMRSDHYHAYRGSSDGSCMYVAVVAVLKVGEGGGVAAFLSNDWVGVAGWTG